MTIREKMLAAGALALTLLALTGVATLMIHLARQGEADIEPAEIAKPAETPIPPPRPYCVHGPDGPQMFCPITMNYPEVDASVCFGDDMVCLGLCMICAAKIDGKWQEVNGWVEPGLSGGVGERRVEVEDR